MMPKSTFTAEVPPAGTAVSAEIGGGEILWDDSTTMLWDDGTSILWSYNTDVSPDVYYQSSLPRTTFSGEVEA